MGGPWPPATPHPTIANTMQSFFTRRGECGVPELGIASSARARAGQMREERPTIPSCSRLISRDDPPRTTTSPRRAGVHQDPETSCSLADANRADLDGRPLEPLPNTAPTDGGLPHGVSPAGGGNRAKLPGFLYGTSAGPWLPNPIHPTHRTSNSCRIREVPFTLHESTSGVAHVRRSRPLPVRIRSATLARFWRHELTWLPPQL